MKAMVLAAGLGLRMRPLTLLRAKPALPVLNRPLLHWTLDLLARHGVREVVINTHHLPQTVTRAVGDGRGFGLTVTYSREGTLLGTGGGPRRMRKFFGDEPFLLVNGDVLFDFDLTRLRARHLASGARATLGLKANPDTSRYGPIVTGPGGWVRSLAGLPRAAKGRASLFTGVHVLDPSLLERLPIGPSDSVKDLYAGMIVAGERVLGVRMRGAWYDLGSPSLYLRSQVSLLESAFCGHSGLRVDPQACVRKGARVTGSVVGTRTLVEEGARVVDSVVWEDVKIGRGARVRGCILTNAVTVAAGERIEGCIVLRDGGGRKLRRPAGAKRRGDQWHTDL